MCVRENVCSESSFTPVVFMDLSLLLAKGNLTMLAQVNIGTVCLTAHSSNNVCFLYYYSDLCLCVEDRFPGDATVELLFSSGPQKRGTHLSTELFHHSSIR